MPSTVALISMIGVSMLALTAFCQSSIAQSRKSPCGGPPALLTRMSGSGQAASACWRPSSVVMSPATAVTLAPVSRRISAAVCSSVSAVRAVIDELDPGPPQRHRAGAAQPLARRADDRLASGDSQIQHVSLHRVVGGALSAAPATRYSRPAAWRHRSCRAPGNSRPAISSAPTLPASEKRACRRRRRRVEVRAIINCTDALR